MIELKNGSAGYGKSMVLKDVSAAFEKGRLTGVIGVNGSGKSTLLKAILAMIPISGGRIMIDGYPLDRMTRIGIARKAAYIAQGKSAPDMTVEQLVLHGRFPHLNYPRRYTGRDREIALAAMAQAGIAEHARKPLRALSGGMRQNAYIAMALAQGTDYILLDEPTTYLDIARQLELMKTLKSLADHGKGIVCVMHDLPMAMNFSDRIVLLDEGRILIDDKPEQVCKQHIIDSVFGVALERSADGRTYSYRY